MHAFLDASQRKLLAFLEQTAVSQGITARFLPDAPIADGEEGPVYAEWAHQSTDYYETITREFARRHSNINTSPVSIYYLPRAFYICPNLVSFDIPGQSPTTHLYAPPPPRLTR